MENRVIIPLLCAAALAYACGPWTHSNSSTPENVTDAAQTSAPPPHVHHKKSHDVATTFDVAQTKTSNGHHLDFALRVTNNTAKTVELRFANGMTHDFIVMDSLGRTVWRWSDGRMFTQAMQSKTVKSKDSVTIEDGWDTRNAHGQYVAVATLNTDAHPVERRVAFTLP